MRYLRWILKLVLFLLLLGFALKNTEPVTVRYVLGLQWSAPLSLVMLLFFVTGAVLGVIAALTLAYRQRRELASLRDAAAGPDRARPTARQPDIPVV